MSLSDAERRDGALKPETVHLAVQQVLNNGYVLFEGVLPRTLVSQMYDAFTRTFNAYIAKTDPNRGANRYQMHVPFEPPFNDERIITSPFVLPIVEALVGEDCICHYFASDTPLPGSAYQDAHADIFPLFPETAMVMPPYSIVVNIPLVDFREDNGPLEIWPGGTHHYVASR